MQGCSHPSFDQEGEITQEELDRQEAEQNLTLSNWRFFVAMQGEEETPGGGHDQAS